MSAAEPGPRLLHLAREYGKHLREPPRPALPSEPVRVSLRYVANQPAGAPCWRAIVEPSGALPEAGLVVHRVTFSAPCWTEQGARGHVVGIGRVEWEPGEGLQLRVR